MLRNLIGFTETMELVEEFPECMALFIDREMYVLDFWRKNG